MSSRLSLFLFFFWLELGFLRVQMDPQGSLFLVCVPTEEKEWVAIAISEKQMKPPNE
eukprot:gene1790-1085_t